MSEQSYFKWRRWGFAWSWWGDTMMIVKLPDGTKWFRIAFGLFEKIDH